MMHFNGAPAPDAAVLATMDENIKKEVSWLNDQLTEPYLVGDQISIADIQVFYELTTGFFMLGRKLAEWPNVVAWVDRMKSEKILTELNMEAIPLMKEAATAIQAYQG